MQHFIDSNLKLVNVSISSPSIVKENESVKLKANIDLKYHECEMSSRTSVYRFAQ